MNPDPEELSPSEAMPVPVERLLIGLWQQREDLGVIADELLAIFQRHGLTPPQDKENQA